MGITDRRRGIAFKMGILLQGVVFGLSATATTSRLGGAEGISERFSRFDPSSEAESRVHSSTRASSEAKRLGSSEGRRAGCSDAAGDLSMSVVQPGNLSRGARRPSALVASGVA